jgi:hypothetical protein
VQLKDALPFASFDSKGNSLSLKPLLAHIKAAPYIIKIVLTDSNLVPKSTKYSLAVSVIGQKEAVTQNSTKQLSDSLPSPLKFDFNKYREKYGNQFK